MAFDGVFLNCMIKRAFASSHRRAGGQGFSADKERLRAQHERPQLYRKAAHFGRPLRRQIQLTDAAIENPTSPPMLCMLLRKRLVGAKLCAVTQPGLEAGGLS